VVLHTHHEAPSIILWRTADSTLQPMSSDVGLFPIACLCLLHFVSPQEYSAFIAPHPLRGDRPVIIVPLILYSDDTSGNKSKRWNKFDSWCLKLTGLPKEMNSQLQYIFHISSSNKVRDVAAHTPYVY